MRYSITSELSEKNISLADVNLILSPEGVQKLMQVIQQGNQSTSSK